ncbi:trypsin inhibitor DE5 alpha chain-like [Prosopis cineraria]|uniref:trypsin inhibitor DE5 alpha chain-like n=1 Tax=Prosopis cineraria TaxID=364024 RepID=UPI00240F74D1|nr:trypsin inhibitor DE5 alpha chain-like [Prosopis cineraria]
MGVDRNAQHVVFLHGTQTTCKRSTWLFLLKLEQNGNYAAFACPKSLFLFAFTTSTLGHGLLDMDGEPMNNGGLYYIFPVIRGKGGGLELARTGKESCPRTVLQAPSETSKSWPTRLASPVLMLTLNPGFPLTIIFHHQNPPCCHRHSRLQWKVSKESQIVKIASREEEQIFGPFQIQPHRDAYKLVYCVSHSRDNHGCKDLGISIDDDDNRRLVVKDDDPFIVQFKKADRSGDELHMVE